jgi:hypothetical protein
VLADPLPAGRSVPSLLGATDQSDVASAEIYDPATGKFSATGSMSMARSCPTATLLPDGRVLVAGGSNSASQSMLLSAELYQP